MSNAIWVAILISAAGTYLMHLLPLLWMQRRLRRWDDEEREAMPQWLSILGPMMIAAVLGVSLAPGHASIAAWLATAVGVIATLAV
jgi:branched-subunit amino acid transport protein